MKILLLLSILLASTTFAQIDTSLTSQKSSALNSRESDSTNSEKFELPEPGFKYSLPSNSFYADRMELNLVALDYFNTQLHSYQNHELYPQSLSNDFKKYNHNLLSAMKMIPGFQKKNDLGVFGDILGYTNAAATLGLLIYHLHKYKDKY